jgi:hypothetical protein
MEMEEVMTHLLAGMKPEIRTNQAKVDANLKEMKEEMVARVKAVIQNNQEEMLSRMETIQEKTDAKIDSNQEKKEAMIDTNNEKYEVLRGTLIFWMNIHQAKTESTEEEMKANMNIIKRRWRLQYTPSGSS